MNGRGRPKMPGLLTPREREVLDLLRRGLSNREIAERLGISLAGAKFHVSEIISKLGVGSREEAAAWRPERSARALVFLSLFRRFGRVSAAGAGAVLIVVSLLVWRAREDAPRATERVESGPTEVTYSEPGQQLAGSMGRLLRIEGNVLTIDDGEGERSFLFDAATEVHRAIGNAWTVDHDVSRLRTGDYVFISVRRQPDGSALAVAVSANAFVTRDGIVAARGDDYFDARLRRDRLSPEFEDTPTRVWLDPKATLNGVRLDLLKQVGSLDYLPVGSHVSFQGYIADDGSRVALLLWSGGD